MVAATEEREVSAWSPFRHRVFAVLWVAMLLSNVGGWMHDVGAGWLMTTLNPSPLLVSLVQAATTLPVFLLALPAGALADIVDRRRLLLIAKIYMTVIAAGMGIVVLAGRMMPVGLLLFTVALGAGTALINPAWQAIVPQLVPRAAARVGRRSEQRRHQRQPCDWACACGRRDRDSRARIAVLVQRNQLSRSHRRVALVEATCPGAPAIARRTLGRGDACGRALRALEQAAQSHAWCARSGFCCSRARIGRYCH